jgi:undecaprenyl-diphosphatase
MKRWHIVLIVIVGVLGAVRLATRNNFHEVTTGEVYRSAQLSPGTLKSKVETHGIRTVVSLRRPRPKESWYRNEKQAAAELGIGHHDIAMDLTFSPRIDHLLELRDLLEGAPKPLLVHCRAGADRTGLAAIMAKLLDGESTLDEARAQVGPRYHAFDDDSIGLPLFDGYVSWLATEGLAHTSERFNQWLENEYTDLSGNIHFLVDPIEGQLWERPWGLIAEGHEFHVSRADTDTLELTGWAFDTRNFSLLDSVEAYLGDTRFEENWYGIYQPWLINDFGREEWLDSGWLASHPLAGFEDGCHELKLKFTREDGSTWTSPPSAKICIS